MKAIMLVENDDGTRMAYEMSRATMDVEHDYDMRYLDPRIILQALPSRTFITIKGELLSGYVWKPGQDFNFGNEQSAIDAPRQELPHAEH